MRSSGEDLGMISALMESNREVSTNSGEVTGSIDMEIENVINNEIRYLTAVKIQTFDHSFSRDDGSVLDIRDIGFLQNFLLQGCHLIAVDVVPNFNGFLVVL